MSQVKERPILFSAPMVRAILEGRKTVTRRAVKFPFIDRAVGCELSGNEIGPEEIRNNCPYGVAGQRLWVRETHADIGCRLTYRADLDDGAHCKVAKWTPAIHMFRKHSRILLEITDVRVERLQDISEGQAVDEGLIWEGVKDGQTYWNHTDHRYPPGSHQQLSVSGTDAVSAFRNLWKSTGGDWEANPWVWVVEFKRVQP
ncbi:hypothetical protein PkP19E3_17775 [Pseudomonas koreensis]|nr:hypothetical protein PkP19E3_17775 [Pseudomonas koreensis]